MATDGPPQSYANHQKSVPVPYRVALLILMINLGYSGYVAATSFSWEAVISLLVALALVMIGWFARLFALGAQDRVIRLEERMRLRELLPPDQGGVIDNLTTEQLIALRFASDGEVGALVTTITAEGIQDRKEIKKRVANWRADHQRL